MSYIILCDTLITDGKEYKNASLQIENGKIAAVGVENAGIGEHPDAEVIHLNDLRLMPGLIDIHVHGGNDNDTMDSSYDAINAISKFKLKEGVTSFCPTTVTTTLQKTKAAVASVKEAISRQTDGAEVLGSFLEGPYICKKYKGAHPEEHIREIDMEEIRELCECGGGTIKRFAIAPELNNAMEAVAYLRNNNINVAIGHSNSTSAIVNEAISKGANSAIHTYNAMSPLNHREVGMVGAVMLNDDIYAEIICDLIHVHADAVKILLKCKSPDKVVLVTDCMCAGGLKDGSYKLGELDVVVADGTARLTDGTLAGSTLNLITAVKNIHTACDVPLCDAVKMATQNPARVIGMSDRKGRIAVGMDADLVALDSDFNIRFVMVGGEVKSPITNDIK